MKYRVTLTKDERSSLQKKISSGRAPAREIMHAQVLLNVDRGGPALSDVAAAKVLGISSRTVQRTREKYSRLSLDSALRRKPQPERPKKRKVGDELEVRIIALACSDPPEGRTRWTLRLLSEKVVELGCREGPISYECIRQTLKKMNFDLIKSRDG